jgi:glycosyl transferase family 87
MTLVAGLPSVALLVLWGLAAVGGLLVVTDALRRRLNPARPRLVVLAVTAAAAPLTLPFAVGLLFGNFDVFFPLLYGAMLLAVLDPERRVRAIGGVALAVAALKLHPASMGLWFPVRAARDRASGGGLVVVSAIVAGVAIVLASLLLGGLQLWLDYGQVIRAGTGAVVVDARNAGIAAVIAGLVGGGDPMARTLHLAVGVVALVVTVWAGWRGRDPLEGFAWATAASLSTLPITWYHYPNALIPVAIAAWLRADQAAIGRVRAAIVGAMAVAAISIALLPLLWGAIGLVILAARWSRSEPSPVATEAPPAPAPAAG